LSLTAFFCTCFLQPSFDKVLQEEIPELEMVHLAALYMELRSIGQTPPIIDATDLRRNPEVLQSPALLSIFSTLVDIPNITRFVLQNQLIGVRLNCLGRVYVILAVSSQ
jgi:hypothetical protein